MEFRIFVVLLALLSAGCNETDNDTTPTVLEGTWLSACLEIVIPAPSSLEIKKIFQGNTVTTYSKLYSDTNCSVLVEDTISNDPFLSTTDNSSLNFTIGNSITIVDGSTAKEIDFYLPDGSTISSIFQLLDSDSTLVFGMSCEFIPPFAMETQCPDGRSLVIDAFSARYYKI